MTRQMPQRVSAPPLMAPNRMEPVTEPLPVATRIIVPRRTPGVCLFGEYEGGGYDEPRFLVSRGDGQMVLVSRMLNAVLLAVSGDRTLAQVAESASREFGATLSPQAAHYLIENKLEPLGLVALGRPVAEAPKPNPLLALSLHRILLPANVVRRIAAIFAPLFIPPVVATVVLAVLTLDVWLLASGQVDASLYAAVGSPGLMLAVFGVLLANTLFHEFGHAAGCHYGGGLPGPIGVGVLIVVPAFYTNVTDAYRLDRRGRLRTDLGGVYFNAVFALFLGVIQVLTGFAALPAVIVLIHLQMLQQMIPLIRLDGYYILGDLVGVPNLFEQIPLVLRQVIFRREPARPVTNLRRRARVIITSWVAVVVPVLLAALVNMVIFLPRYLSTALVNIERYWWIYMAGFHESDVGTMIVALLAIAILLVPWAGISSLVARTIAKIGRGIARRMRAARTGLKSGARRDIGYQSRGFR